MTCSVDECDRPRAGRGLCNLHYDRARRAGTLQEYALPQKGHQFSPGNLFGLPDAFWSQVEIRADGCWQWLGKPGAQGYGHITIRGISRTAHALAFLASGGERPEGWTLDHLCHTADRTCLGGSCAHRLCVNPQHLEAVPRGVNVQRGRRWAVKPTKCRRGHEYGPNNENRYANGSGCRLCRQENGRAA